MVIALIFLINMFLSMFSLSISGNSCKFFPCKTIQFLPTWVSFFAVNQNVLKKVTEFSYRKSWVHSEREWWRWSKKINNYIWLVVLTFFFMLEVRYCNRRLYGKLCQWGMMGRGAGGVRVFLNNHVSSKKGNSHYYQTWLEVKTESLSPIGKYGSLP